MPAQRTGRAPEVRNNWELTQPIRRNLLHGLIYSHVCVRSSTPGFAGCLVRPLLAPGSIIPSLNSFPGPDRDGEELACGLAFSTVGWDIACWG